MTWGDEGHITASSTSCLESPDRGYLEHAFEIIPGCGVAKLPNRTDIRGVFLRWMVDLQGDESALVGPDSPTVPAERVLWGSKMERKRLTAVGLRGW